MPTYSPSVFSRIKHEIDVLVSAAGNDRVRGSHVGVEIERLSQRDVDRAVAFADRRLERTLEREPRALDRIERRVGDRIAERATPAMPATCVSHSMSAPAAVENRDRRVADRRTDAVAGNQCDWSWTSGESHGFGIGDRSRHRASRWLAAQRRRERHSPDRSPRRPSRSTPRVIVRRATQRATASDAHPVGRRRSSAPLRRRHLLEAQLDGHQR